MDEAAALPLKKSCPAVTAECMRLSQTKVIPNPAGSLCTGERLPVLPVETSKGNTRCVARASYTAAGARSCVSV